jgi:hypothetical protein
MAAVYMMMSTRTQRLLCKWNVMSHTAADLHGYMYVWTSTDVNIVFVNGMLSQYCSRHVRAYICALSALVECSFGYSCSLGSGHAYVCRVLVFHSDRWYACTVTIFADYVYYESPTACVYTCIHIYAHICTYMHNKPWNQAYTKRQAHHINAHIHLIHVHCLTDSYGVCISALVHSFNRSNFTYG